MTINDQQLAQSHTWNEILSQPRVWQTVVERTRQNPLLDRLFTASVDRKLWLFVGCGTSFYLSEAAAQSWTLLTGQPARAIPASEVLLFPKLFTPEAAVTQAVVISRSGHTSEAVRAAVVLEQDLRIPTLGITCAEQSPLERACAQTLVLRAADETSTVMTRSFTGMLVSLQTLAARHAGRDHFITELHDMAVRFAPRLRGLASSVETFVSQHSIANYVFLGQGPFYGIAREAALKVMEMSCSYSQFFHALEFRHGPKAIVSPTTCLTFFLSDSARKLEAEVLTEVKELGGITVAICNRASESIRSASDLVVEADLGGDELSLLAPYIVPGQLLGFFTGLRKGLNPDEPKNLTRVVVLD